MPALGGAVCCLVKMFVRACQASARNLEPRPRIDGVRRWCAEFRFVEAGSNQQQKLAARRGLLSHRGKPSGPYFGAVPPLPVVVAGVVVAGVLPRLTSRRP